MTHSYSYRRQTRKKFANAFKTKGHIRISWYLTTYKIGEYVDILVDGSAHKGMPYKLYPGRTTGRVFNVKPRSRYVDVIIHR
jgi:large subunit ribosomal protein L21e